MNLNLPLRRTGNQALHQTHLCLATMFFPQGLHPTDLVSPVGTPVSSQTYISFF